ncbi:protein phosphatase 1 regulatory subunit 12A isoform X4 [Chironomus tepperi]|uniref:protein phosphatase 1 regulatory subunit 12A isoform X4 n=1 Tax=Chironomus tepperi TaxID=113505 RepID=UPI00391F94C2
MALSNKTAFSKRAEQLKRYEDSETNRESVVPKNLKDRRVRFSAGCIFLAACAAGDKDEVLNMLNSGGADIDTANVDGLTALHQACIEDNLDMVEFLVSHGADVNRKDNEGWTPLHATSSCGIVSIARYLIENGADLAAVNSDGELPIDIAGTNAMADLLQRYIDEQGIDCDDARQQEEKTMLADAKKWLRSDASEADRPHSKTGATALHVAAAKGYTKVLSLLLAGRANVDRQDNDGWTPLHAACYWGKKEAAQMLIASMADLDIQNYSNQTCIDIAPKDMVPWLEELRKNNKRTKRRPISQIRISDNNLENNIESPPKVIRVELKSPIEPEQTTNTESESDSESEEESEESESEEEEQNKTNNNNNKTETVREQIQSTVPKVNDSNSEIGRTNAQDENTQKTQVPEKENQTNDSEVILRRTQSFENDENKKANEKTPPTSPSTTPSTPSLTPSSVHLRSYEKPTPKQESAVGALMTANQNIIDLIARRYSSPAESLNNITNTVNIANARKNSATDVAIKIPEKTEKSDESQKEIPNQSPSPTSPSSTMLNKLSPGNIFKNIFKSFVPPTRDEESETQRKAHAKRVRETRRSTQGVTLDEIKSAEQLVKLKNASNSNGNTENASSELNERLSESTAPAATEDSSVSDKTEVNVNYTISSPLRKTLRQSSEKDEDGNEPKISATFTIAPPPRSNTSSISSLANRLEKGLSIETTSANSVTATINVPLISSAKSTSSTNSNSDTDASKKTEHPSPPIPTPRSLFDIDNASSLKLADKLQQEARKYDVNTIDESSTTTTTTTSTNEPLSYLNEPLPPSPIHHTIFGERRPSWRLKNDYNNKFKLEDSSQSSTSTKGNNSTTPHISSTTNGVTQEPIKTTVISAAPREQNSTENTNSNETTTTTTTGAVTTTLPSKEPQITSNRSDDDKENDKENDNRGGLSAQAAIQRRRRPKRRSTGVVHVDMEEIDQEYRHEVPADNDESKNLSGNESRSRAESLVSNSLVDTNDDGEFIDYKALYEAAKAENDQLRLSLKSKEHDLAAAKSALERLTAAATKSSLSENEKREKRAMERKISEMEEELKLLNKYKQENERLRAENRALTRVVSKLTTSAQNQLLNKQ